MRRNMLDVRGLGSVQKSQSSKAAANLGRGAYTQYVSTQNWRERRFACSILKGGSFVFNRPPQRTRGA